MYQDLVRKSPLRTLERALNGELSPGSIGAVVSLKGVGKTSTLIQIALDYLFQDKKVIHVASNQTAAQVDHRYQVLFSEIFKTANLKQKNLVYESLVKQRVIVSIHDEIETINKLIHSLETLVFDANFQAHVVVIDGIDHSFVVGSNLKKLTSAIKKLNVRVWISLDAEKYFDKALPFESSILRSLILLEDTEKGTSITLQLAGSRVDRLGLRINPVTMLLNDQ